MKVQQYKHSKDTQGKPLQFDTFAMFADHVRGLLLEERIPASDSPTDIKLAKEGMTGIGPYLLIGTRKNTDVVTMSCIALDLDHEVDLVAIEARVVELGWEACIHATPTDTPEDRRVRIYVNSGEHSPTHAKQARAWATEQLGCVTDTKTFDESRFFFAGTLKGTPPRYYRYFIGRPCSLPIFEDEAADLVLPKPTRKETPTQTAAPPTTSTTPHPAVLAKACEILSAATYRTKDTHEGAGTEIASAAAKLVRGLQIDEARAFHLLRASYPGNEQWTDTELRRKITQASTFNKPPVGSMLAGLKLDAPVPPPVLEGRWIHFTSDEIDYPPKSKWLLTRGDNQQGAMPLGKAIGLSASGGTGKTILLCQLAVAVASGTRWFDFDVAAPGKVLLLLGEEDRDEAQRRLSRACRLIPSDPLNTYAQRRLATLKNIVVCPLAGAQVAIVQSDDRRNIEHTRFLAELREKLEQEGPWSLVIMDPLSRFSSGESEKDNSAATRFVQAVETLCEAPGNPSVIVSTHSSQASQEAGRPGMRGVTALVDGFRQTFFLNARGGGAHRGVTLGSRKSNYTLPLEDTMLSWRNDGGGAFLELASDEERELILEVEAEVKAAKKPPKKAAIAKAPPVEDESKSKDEPKYSWDDDDE